MVSFDGIMVVYVIILDLKEDVFVYLEVWGNGVDGFCAVPRCLMAIHIVAGIDFEPRIERDSYCGIPSVGLAGSCECSGSCGSLRSS
mgnify:CR=1 FL=1